MIRPQHDEDPIIHRYTRAQAIEDGVLVDLTAWARETGFVIPVACTSTVWNQWIVPPEGTRELGQSERGRGHDVLWMLYVAIRRAPGSAGSPGREQLTYDVLFLDANGKHQTVTFKAVCGPGDHGEPVMTIMQINED